MAEPCASCLLYFGLTGALAFQIFEPRGVFLLFSTLALALGFRGLYALLLRRSPPQVWPGSPQYASRYVSCVHAIALVAIALAWDWMGSPSAKGRWAAIATAVPLGYLAHDAHLTLTTPSLRDPAMLAHHLAFSLLAAGAPARYPDKVAQAYLAEVSTPLLHAGWMMLKAGAHKTYPKPFSAIGLSLLAAFLYFRVYALTRLTAEAYYASEWVCFGASACLALLNWYWFARLVALGAILARGATLARGAEPA